MCGIAEVQLQLHLTGEHRTGLGTQSLSWIGTWSETFLHSSIIWSLALGITSQASLSKEGPTDSAQYSREGCRCEGVAGSIGSSSSMNVLPGARDLGGALTLSTTEFKVRGKSSVDLCFFSRG